MHNRSAGKIKNAHLLQPTSLSPDPMAKRVIYQSRPEKAVKQEALEFNPFHESARNQCRGNDGKHHLKRSKKFMRDGFSIGGVRLGADSLKTKKIQTSDQSTDVRTEGKRISVKHPLNSDQGHEDIA